MLSSILTFILAWYNLPFTFLLAVCLLMVVMQWVGLGGDHESNPEPITAADADADADLDIDADTDFDVDGDFDHDLGSDFDHDLDGNLDHDAELGDTAGEHGIHEPGLDSGFSLLAYLGVGRAPLLITLLLLFGAVGLTGWGFNSFILRISGTYPALAMAGALAVSLGVGSLISSRIARAIGRTLPPVSTTVTSAQALVGRRGTVISPFVDQRYGMVHLRDSAGTLISVFAVTHEDKLIRRGDEVLFIDYDADKHLYTVIRASH